MLQEFVNQMKEWIAGGPCQVPMKEVPAGRQRAGYSALVRARDAELFHLGLQGRSFHAEPGGGTLGTAQHPVGFT